MASVHRLFDGPQADDENDDDDPCPPEAHAGGGTATGREYQLQAGPTNVRWLRSELGSTNMPGVFLRGGRLVFVASVGTAGYIEPRHADDDNGPATVVPLSPLGLSTRVGDHYEVVKWNAKIKQLVPAHFPTEDAARVMEATDQLPYVKLLKGVTHTAVARADNGILTEPGYDETSGYLLEPNVDVDPIPTAPTRAQIDEATQFLRYLVAEFVWGDEHSEANFWGAMLTPLMRLATPAPYKLVAITARERGSGKSLLADLLSITHGGTLSTWPTNDDELEKFISSTLHCTTAPIVKVDNVRGVLQSGRLEALATSATYAARILGSTNKTQLANDRLWVFTGNNMSVGGDLARRMLWIDIDPKVEKPEERTDFKIKDLPQFVRAHRGKALHALLTWVAAWDAAGRPLKGEPTSDSYGRWIAAVRSILDTAGVPGTFAAPNAEREATSNPEETEWTEFLSAIHEVFGTQRWTARMVGEAIDKAPGHFTPRERQLSKAQEDGELLKESLPDQLLEKARRDGGAGVRKSLGKWVGFRVGQFHGGYTVLHAGEDTKSKAAYWQVFHKDDEDYAKLLERLQAKRTGTEA